MRNILKRMKNMKKYLNIIMIALLLTSTVFATEIAQNVEVIFNTIKVKVNGKDIEADNIFYKGKTYLSLRDISEALDKDVEWDNETKTAEVNDKDINKQNPVVTIELDNGDKIKIELYPHIAPNTVNNFISLINKEYYNGLDFHRVIPGFMIQGGDPAGNGSGGPGYAIEGEFTKNGIENNLQHTRGIISMARTATPNSAGSQFFIVVEDSHSLNGEYAAFGKVIEGMDFVDKIAGVDSDGNDKPSTPQIMKSVSVEVFDGTYGEPEIIK